MNHKYYQLILFLFFFSFNAAFSQCMQTLKEREKTELAEIICEATVLDKDYFLSEQDAHIYTSYLLQINSLQKGPLNIDTIQLITKGGQWNDIIEIVHPNLSIQLDYHGNFYLKKSDQPLNSSPKWGQYLVYEAAIGSQSYSPKKVSLSNRIDPPTIDSFSPTQIEAGTASLLTIKGQNFGPNANGLAKVKFRNPDFYNITFSYQSVPPNHIISWSDTEIQVLIPGNDPIIGHSGAGSGPIRVVNSTGGEDDSVDSLKININKLVLGLKPVHMINQNDYGGYTLTYNNDFYGDESARAATERALQTWQCNTQTNIITDDQTSTANCATNDGINLISFDHQCELPIATLAETTHWIYTCDNDEGIIVETDLIINTDINWNHGPNDSNNDQKDLESLILHELGHVQGLAHVSDFYATMYPAQYNGIDQRTIDPNGILCANLIKDESQITHCDYDNFSPYIEAKLNINDTTQECVLDTLSQTSTPNFEIYPNPITDNQVLEINGVPLHQINEFITFRIHATNGQLLFEEKINAAQAYSIHPKIMNQLSTGIYILSIESKEQFFQTRLVKW